LLAGTMAERAQGYEEDASIVRELITRIAGQATA
jgi:hypothetical protein